MRVYVQASISIESSIESKNKVFNVGPFSAEVENVKDASLKVLDIGEALENATKRPVGKTLIEVFKDEWKRTKSSETSSPFVNNPPLPEN
jgi:hypothetical protein